MQLSAHFTLAEFVVSETAARAGIDNDPPLEIVAALKRTAQGLEAVRVRLGGASVDDVERAALASLAAYGADDALVRGIVASTAETLRAGGDPGGVVAETLAELAALEGL